MDLLPAELLAAIFSWLGTARAVAKVLVVCKRWNEVGNGNGIWRRLLCMETGVQTPTIKRENYKLALQNHRKWWPLVQENLKKMSDTSNLEKCLSNLEINAHDPQTGYTLLHLAILPQKGGLWDVFRAILQSGAEISSQANDGSTPLHLSIKYKKDSVSQFLINRGASIEIKNVHNESPLDLLTQAGDTEMLKFCHNKFPKMSLYPMCNAAKAGNLDQIVQLLQSGVDINQPDINGKTALHWAAETMNLKLAKLLLKRGAESCARNVKNQTPAHYAAYMGNREILAELVAHHPGTPRDLYSKRNQSGESVFLYACHWGHAAMVKVMLPHVNLEDTDIYQNNCLHHAAAGLSVTVARVLSTIDTVVLQKLKQSKNSGGFVPAAAVARGYHTELMDLLRAED
eukprot:TRINITY_DN6036_c0_g1_i1.p1 TRINITY_DN6036_c0_g1~~TRINITY_DN6036_c0_g1_i1.p1  ORF type:complete len:400 (-),score=56.01 TRINITY_DN6036_c0_g1_i1:551-1750(-)